MLYHSEVTPISGGAQLSVYMQYHGQSIKNYNDSGESHKSIHEVIRLLRGQLRGLPGVNLLFEIKKTIQDGLPEDSPLLSVLEKGEEPLLLEGLGNHFPEIILNSMDSFAQKMLQKKQNDDVLRIQFTVSEEKRVITNKDSVDVMSLIISDNGCGFPEQMIADQALFKNQRGDVSGKKKQVNPSRAITFGGNGRALRACRDWVLGGVVRIKSGRGYDEIKTHGKDDINDISFSNDKTSGGAVLTLTCQTKQPEVEVLVSSDSDNEDIFSFSDSSPLGRTPGVTSSYGSAPVSSEPSNRATPVLSSPTDPKQASCSFFAIPSNRRQQGRADANNAPNI